MKPTSKSSAITFISVTIYIYINLYITSVLIHHSQFYIYKFVNDEWVYCLYCIMPFNVFHNFSLEPMSAVSISPFKGYRIGFITSKWIPVCICWKNSLFIQGINYSLFNSCILITAAMGHTSGPHDMFLIPMHLLCQGHPWKCQILYLDSNYWTLCF